MLNSIIVIGNYSSGKSSLINYLFNEPLIKTGYNDENKKRIIKYDEFGGKIIDTWGLNIKGRNISDFKYYIKFSHMIFIVCKFDNYKSIDTAEYIEYCNFLRTDLKKKIFILL